jgi:hypothetical protein
LPLARLRRTADDLGLDLTIVTRDSATRIMAGQVGLRVQWRIKGGKRQVADRQETGSVPALASHLPSSHPQASSSTVHSPFPSGALAVVLLLLGLALANLILPHATVIVTPRTTRLETTVEIRADPDLTAVDVTGHRIPARRLEVTLDRQAQEPTSARMDVPETPAEGTVVFINQTESEVEIPPGTVVSTGDESAVAFRTLEAVKVPGPAGTTARVWVQAVEPGTRGHVPAHAISRLDPSLGLPVAVVNDQPTTGGTVRTVGVVTQEERDRIRDALFERTRQEALQAMQAQLWESEIPVKDSVEIRVVNESFSEPVGAVADTITLDLTLHVEATAVDFDQIRQLAEVILERQVPEGQIMIDGTRETEVGPVLGVEGDVVRVEGRASAVVRSEIRERDVKSVVRGRRVDEAVTLLGERFPLETAPIIDLSHGWSRRLPWLTLRIDVIIRNSLTIMGGNWFYETNHGPRRG